MLGAAPNGLHGSPHVTLARYQIPAGRQELGCFNAAAFIDSQRRSLHTIRQHLCPDDVAVTFYDGVSAAQLMSFVRIESGVNSSENYVRASIPCHFPDFVPTERIRGVDSDADNIARLDLVGVYRF